MTWIAIIALALASYGAIVVGLRVPRGGREAVGAALALGVAGYALQGSPGVPGAPKVAVAQANLGGAFVVAQRKALTDDIGPSGRWLIISDAMMRQGQYQTAAGVLRGAVRANPQDGEAWVALGNALVWHEQGALSPAALFAFRRAAEIDPAAPAPPYFLGLALAQAGRFAEARALWAQVLASAPADAPWRAPLAEQLRRLDLLVAAAQAAQRP